MAHRSVTPIEAAEFRGFCKAEPKVRARLTPDGRAAINALAGVAA